MHHEEKDGPFFSFFVEVTIARYANVTHLHVTVARHARSWHYRQNRRPAEGLLYFLEGQKKDFRTI